MAAGGRMSMVVIAVCLGSYCTDLSDIERRPTAPTDVAVVLNNAPLLGEIAVSPLINERDAALMGATELTFSLSESVDPDGDPLSYSWEFGDGGTATGKSPRYVYNTGGAFAVRVTVSDGRGGTAIATRSVVVATLNGTWSGRITPRIGSVLAATQFTLVVTHSGRSLTGDVD